MEHSYRDLAAKTSEHLSEGFQKLPGVFPSVFCTMNYTVLGSQIPHLSKETHKKASMTVHLTPLLLPESTEIRHPAP